MKDWTMVSTVVSVFLVIAGGLTSLVLRPITLSLADLKTTVIEQEIRVRALEISDARTGVNLTNLTESINRLIDKMDTFAETGNENSEELVRRRTPL